MWPLLVFAPFNRPHLISHYFSIETVSLSCTISEIKSNQFIKQKDRSATYIDSISYNLKFKEFTWPWLYSFWEWRTKFEMHSFIYSKDMIGSQKLKQNGSCDSYNAHYGVVCHPKANTWFTGNRLLCVQNLTTVASAVIESWLRPQKFMGHVTWPRPFQKWFVIHELRLATFNLPTKLDISVSTLPNTKM